MCGVYACAHTNTNTLQNNTNTQNTQKQRPETKFDWNENFMLEVADGEDND